MTAATATRSELAVTAKDRYEDDAVAVNRVLAGDAEAFDGIVARWQGPLVNLAYRYCRNRGEAEEMAQEAFLKIYRGLAKWRQDSRFSTWLYAVASNHYRSAMRRKRPVWADFEKVEQLMPTGDLSVEADEASRDEAVRRAVTSLPPKYRDIMVLYYFQDKDLSETSRIAKLAQGTVKARLHRARKILETKLAGLLGNDALEASR
ncbi:MAG: sigma-70 family RNA polymerase sigma factor [Acidobacteria bacterium]|nr:sigma-70 family RNA polymerase sigma factor [Acidobacteriota bacterium]